MADDRQDGVEKRIFDRSPLMLKVRYKRANDFLADYTENISKGGLFIATEESFELGSMVEFEVSFPGLLDPIAIKGEVKWCRQSPDGEERPGIGVQFLPESLGEGQLATLVTRIGKSQPTREESSGETVFRVLLVEDNVVVRDMFRYGIQKMTHSKKLHGARLEVIEADNGREAWDLLQKQKCHLLVIDLYMPIMDGNQVIQHVRKDPQLKDIPIVVVSCGGDEDRDQALKNGADIFLSKPIKLKELVDTVEILMASGHTPKQ